MQCTSFLFLMALINVENENFCLLVLSLLLLLLLLSLVLYCKLDFPHITASWYTATSALFLLIL